MEVNLDDYELTQTDVNESAVVHQDNEPNENADLADFGVPPAPLPSRKPVPKLDASKLLNKHRGYPVLLDKLKAIKYKGKGRERQYLETYLVTYQLWSNRLWPKAKLDDFMIMARNSSKNPDIRRYTRGLIEQEKDERLFGGRGDREDHPHNLNVGESDSNAAGQSRNHTTSTDEMHVPNEIVPEEPIVNDIPDDDELRTIEAAEADLYGDFDF